MGVYLICFGDSEKNLEIALSKKVIGVNKKRSFEKDSKAYLLVKRTNEWTVVARANISELVAENPFEKPNKYLIYSIKNIETCKPYGVSALLKEEFGATYGLTLRSLNLITADSFTKKLENGFKL